MDFFGYFSMKVSVIFHKKPGSVAQSVAHLTPEPEVPSSVPVTYFHSLSADSRRTLASYWQKY